MVPFTTERLSGLEDKMVYTLFYFDKNFMSKSQNSSDSFTSIYRNDLFGLFDVFRFSFALKNFIILKILPEPKSIQ